MSYREIVAVTGLSGLYQLLATKSDGAIVRNLADKTTKFISARLHNVTPLESIEVYTTGDNVRLHNVFQKMTENNGTASIPDNKKGDNNTVKEYFNGVFPEFDHERVYVSDMKKMVKWYDILKANDLLNFDAIEALYKAHSEAAAGEAGSNAAPAKEVVAEEKAPAKKTKAAKAEASEEGEAKAPAKKTRAKKADDDTAGEEKAAAPKKTAAKKTAAKKKTEE